MSSKRARPSGSDSILVASVPNSHVYVRHIAEPGLPLSSVIRLQDPDPDRPGQSTVEKWWPPVMLQPTWLREAAYDVLHIQFGFDAWEPDTLDHALSVAKQRGKPIVYTAHDLRNPHHGDGGSLHTRQLGVVMGHADAVITLTEGAAAEINLRWGVQATVLPHPHVVDFPAMAAHQIRRASSVSGHEEFRVGVHVKSLRSNMDPLTILPVLEETVAQLPGAVLQVNGHRDVLERRSPHRHHELATYLEHAERAGRLELHVHDFMDDATLWEYLSGLDVSVLPYQFGTHSGWLEACRDLGTTVVAPTCGYYADQGPVLSYDRKDDLFEPETLSTAITRAYEERPDWSATVEDRRAQRGLVAGAHDSLYRRVLS